MWADTFDQHSFVANVVITPLALVADATRAGFTGFHESPVWLSLLVTALAAACTFAGGA